eukprot:TRINITY_DN30805_c0_g1_i1.p1 TRINITY_DN30805_c0_g1~~TRINITY_DN30805_c0_g1_i1.p1  ORF type:complete len:331 (-),score=83.90 TRINITY_DN30805_c0_g1_i1:15-1007(-)
MCIRDRDSVFQENAEEAQRLIQETVKRERERLRTETAKFMDAIREEVKQKRDKKNQKEEPKADIVDPEKVVYERAEAISNSHLKGRFASPGVDEKRLTEHFKNMLNAVGLSKRLKDDPTEIVDPLKEFSLGEKQEDRKNSVIFGLDETLVCTCSPKEKCDGIIQLLEPKGKKVGIKVRPFVRGVMTFLVDFYEIIIFTRRPEYEAKQIVKILDLDGKYVKYILSQKHCRKTKSGLYLKDINAINNREIGRLLVIDANIQSFALHLENGYPMLPWKGEADDDEFARLIWKYFHEASVVEDVRDFNKKRVNLTDLESELVQCLLKKKQKQHQ